MCLAVPARIVRLEGEAASVDLAGARVDVSTVLTPEAAVGDWVLVHAGFAIQQINPEEAAQTLRLIAELDEAEHALPPE